MYVSMYVNVYVNMYVCTVTMSKSMRLVQGRCLFVHVLQLFQRKHDPEKQDCLIVVC